MSSIDENVLNIRLVEPPRGKFQLELKDAREAYYDFTSRLSAVVRQLGFAGIALIWIFKSGSQPKEFSIPSDLHIPAILLVVGLASDLLHYVAASLSWGLYQWRKEKSFQESAAPLDTRFDAPRQLNWGGNTFLTIKVLAIGTAYGFLLESLARRFL